MKLFRRTISDKKTKNIIGISILIVLVLTILLTIGFSAFQSSLDIGSLAIFRVNKDIRITSIKLDSTSNNAISNWQEYNTTSISTNVDLPQNNSTITYEVEVTNLGNIEMGILDISGIPENLNYSITNYTLKDMLCDNLDNTQCKLGSITKFLITISYKDNLYNSNNTNYNIKLDFDFRRFYSISYVNLDTTNLPTRALEGDNIEFNLNTPYPVNIHFNGTNNGSYNSSNGKVTINNVEDDIIISYLTMSYFVAYNGVDNLLFNTFSTTNITSFSRNTSLTLSEVQAKVNNNTAYLISTSPTDENYPSNHEVYGWVENNRFYWWSESNVVYYHPNTLGAFRLMTNLTTVDLSGTNTSLVKNFSHWFDKDAKLQTINGRINTSGVVLEYNPSFNYGNDQDENASSGYGLTYMFNDCKVLTSIDTTEIDTTNSSDLKRMFGGCAKLTSLDVSHFNTANAKSMYWMFRKTEKLTEIDIRNFDTSNVESMYGMFITSGVKTLYLGENFNTSKVKQFNRMFDSAASLTTIYAYHDFQTNSKVSDSSMFTNAKKLVGSAGTLDETPYSSSHVNIAYARLAQNGVSGYLTPYNSSAYYTITYDLDGGSATNPTIYNEDTRTFTLSYPTKMGYTFTGWTGSNGQTPELNVTIEQGSTGNRTYVAHWQINTVDMFPKVFAISGSCNFNGSATNITGDTCISDLDDHTNFTNSTYIDTGIALYSSENYQKDYEIYFEISNYNPSNQENLPNYNGQNTIMNSKTENLQVNPGIVLRKKNNQLEVRSFSTSRIDNYSGVSTYKIARINKKIYVSVNGSELTQLDDNTSFNSPFDLTVWFGASKNASGVPFRFSKCTLSNIYIKLGSYS